MRKLKSTRLLLLCMITTVSIVACSLVKPIDLLNLVTPDTGYTLTKNIPYGKHQRQSLDVYQPDKPRPGSPLIVFIYGGAWRVGNKSEYEFVGQAFADEGYRVVIPDYRLYPEVIYPGMIDDVQQAILHVRNNTVELGIPAENIVLIGHSSGAHAAALLSASPDYLGKSSFVSALVALSGPYDLPFDNEEVNVVFSAVEDPDSVNPTELVSGNHPRTLLLHGADDKRVEPWHTFRYERVLRTAGIPVTAHLLEDVGHADIVAAVASPLQFLNSSNEIIVDFLSGL